MSSVAKDLKFCVGALDNLRAFPASVRRDAGYELDKVQNGRDPSDWKPVNTVGAGVREIRIRDASGAFRVLYVAKFAETVYVLHCFQKKTQATRFCRQNRDRDSLSAKRLIQSFSLEKSSSDSRFNA